MRSSLSPCLLAALLPAAGVLAAPPQAQAPADRTELRVKLDPAAQTLAGEAALTVRIAHPGTSELTWLLNGQFDVTSLQGPLVAGWSFSKTAGLLKVRFPKPLGPADRVQFRLRYQGALSRWPEHSPNAFAPAWTELGRSVSWYPVRQDRMPSTFRLTVLGKPGQGLVSFGPFKGGQGLRTLDWNQPGMDLVLCVAPADHLRVWNPVPRVRLVTLDLSEAAATRLGSALGQVMSALTLRLGPLEASSLTVVQSPRQDGGSYALPGFVVLTGLSDAQVSGGLEDILHQVALETAHAWWHGAPAGTWENWLNVSLSEFSALAVLRDVLGEPCFQRRIELKRRACEGLPPLWQFDPGSGQAQSLMENKGVVLLAELEVFVGRERFSALCRELADRKVSRTGAFLDLLEARAGKAVRESFQRRIMAL